MIAPLASAYQDMWGSPLTPLYLLFIYVGMIAGTVCSIYYIGCWARDEISDWRWSRTYRKRRAAELEAAAVTEEA